MAIARRVVALTLAGSTWFSAAGAAQTPATTTPQSRTPLPCTEQVDGRTVACSDDVVVTSTGDALLRSSSVASKIDLPLIETPRSVSIIDRGTLDVMGVINVTQAHDYAVGVTLLDERGPASARGFPVDFYDLRRDGLRTNAWSVREPVAIERVEYVRGSDAVLYGDGSPGAIVNLALKKPLATPRYEVSASGGDLGFRRVTTDLTGPLPGTSHVRYRFVIGSEWLENGFQNDEHRLTVLPTIAVDLGARGTLTFDTEWYDQRGRNYRHTVPATTAAQHGDFSGYPWDLNVSPSDSPYGWTGDDVSPGLRLDLGLGRRSSFHASARYTKIDGDINYQGLSSLAADGRTANRFQYREISTWHEFQTDSFAATTVATGALHHRLIGGVETGLSTADSLIGLVKAPPLDIYNPTYPVLPDPPLAPSGYDVTRLGVYGVDQMHVGAHVVVAPGLRWSHLDIHNRVAAAGEPETTQSVVSPTIGIVVLPRPWWSLYSLYAQGLSPPAPGEYLENGRGLAPSESHTIEGGIKADLSAKLSVTGATYRITRTNVPEALPTGLYRQIGEAQSRGLETEVVGRPAAGLALRGGYAFTKTEITHDVSGFAGNDLPNAPRHKGEAWAQYRVGSGMFSSLTAAAGVVSVSGQFSGRDNVIVVPPFTRLDASTSYDLVRSRLTLALTAENLTNRRYVTSGNNAVFYAAPLRRIALQLTSVF